MTTLRERIEALVTKPATVEGLSPEATVLVTGALRAIQAYLRAALAAPVPRTHTRVTSLGVECGRCSADGVMEIRDGHPWISWGESETSALAAPDEAPSARAAALAEALRGLGDPDEPGRFCDHAAEPCERCAAARRALAAAPDDKETTP